MKATILYTYVALMGMASAQQACEEGKRVTISPGYTVEFKCGKYRLGQPYNNVLSHEDCAAKCQAANIDVCTYHAGQKKCIVGDPNGREGTSTGATYMVRVPEEPEDPFPEEEEDPFKETCEEEKDRFKTELDKCHADLEAGSKTPPSCAVDTWGQGYYLYLQGVNLSDCKQRCKNDSRCLAYSARKASGWSNCYLYDKETADVPHSAYPEWVQYDKRCG
ncbi:uncharacterized protein FIESC28_03101 [Fusarium coffeatum]|uniref:Apple domain-containing protein n=1 Tax=Fusarium coffeatum TaxID=231269 RepID=A0A366S516_9HYPO|nr:uncharacterized protein FIESC28_03101 [Fusarium coffeatum]RBR24102.1 hypothetical protein FIESC28_03101 [Fusarium coffeatum]